MVVRVKRLEILEQHIPYLEQLVVQQATLLDAEYGIKKTAPP
jgi:hypothetical protein